MKQPAVIIVEDAQGALRGGDVELMLAELAKCEDGGAVNLVFLSSEGDLPGQLRTMSGWSTAVEEYGLNLVDEETMRKHLVGVWKLDEQLAGDIVARVGCGMRDVFKRALKGFKPGTSIDAASADLIKAIVKMIIEEAKVSIDVVLEKLRLAELNKAADLTGSRCAAVLLLDRLLRRPTTSVFDTYREFSKRAQARHLSDAPFIYATGSLVEGNIVRRADREDEVTWHRKAMKTAYAALQGSEKYRAMRDGKTA
jgi:hypothetical protein